MRILLLVLAIVTVLSGCVGGEPHAGGEPSDDQPMFPPPGTPAEALGTGTSFNITLSDIPTGSDYILVEVHASADATTNASLTHLAPSSPGTKFCDLLFAPDLDFGFFGDLTESYVSTSMDDAYVDLHDVDPKWTRLNLLPVAIEPSMTGVFLVAIGFHDPAGLLAIGADHSVTLQSEAPMDAWIVGHGSMPCTDRLHLYENGEAVRTLMGAVGSNLGDSFALNGVGRGMVAVGSDGAFEFTLHGPDGTVVDDAGTAMGSMRNLHLLQALPPGEYDANVPYIAGYTNAGASYAFLDLPKWAADALADEE